jgi:hypothetical protein
MPSTGTSCSIAASAIRRSRRIEPMTSFWTDSTEPRMIKAA